MKNMNMDYYDQELYQIEVFVVLQAQVQQLRLLRRGMGGGRRVERGSRIPLLKIHPLTRLSVAILRSYQF